MTGALPADQTAQTGLLAQLATLGPFFALDSHPAQSALAPPWRPLKELFQRPEVLQAHVAAVRVAFAEASGQTAGAVELRVAASMAQLGLTARLICPALGVAVLNGALLEVDPARLRWQPGAGGPVALSIPGDTIASATASAQTPARLSDALAASLLAGPVRALVEASRPFGVSERVLWGNVASVVNGAVAVIGAAAPRLTGRAEEIATGLVNQPPLRGTSQGSDHGTFRRRSCCLVYRLTANPSGVCGDCVLDRAPITRRAGIGPG